MSKLKNEMSNYRPNFANINIQNKKKKLYEIINKVKLKE